MGLLETYGHGGDLVTAAERFGVSAEAFLDYSANINPLGPPARVLEALGRSLTAVIRYPDPGHRAFKRALAARLRLPEDALCKQMERRKRWRWPCSLCSRKAQVW